jgi:hypothetical protein
MMRVDFERVRCPKMWHAVCAASEAALFLIRWRESSSAFIITRAIFRSEAAMTKHGVTLKVTPCLYIECKFSLGDDGWNGSSERPPISVQAASFEQAKSRMELALAQHIDSLLKGRKQNAA